MKKIKMTESQLHMIMKNKNLKEQNDWDRGEIEHTMDFLKREFDNPNSRYKKDIPTNPDITTITIDGGGVARNAFIQKLINSISQNRESINLIIDGKEYTWPVEKPEGYTSIFDKTNNDFESDEPNAESQINEAKEKLLLTFKRFL